MRLCCNTVLTQTGKSVSNTSMNEGSYLQILFPSVLGGAGQDLLGTEWGL